MILKVLPGQEVCDFCSNEDVKWNVACGTIELPQFGFGSSDDWAVCDICIELIRAGKWKELTDRSFECFQAKNGINIDRQMCFNYLNELHGQFRKLYGKITPFVKNVA